MVSNDLDDVETLDIVENIVLCLDGDDTEYMGDFFTLCCMIVLK